MLKRLLLALAFALVFSPALVRADDEPTPNTAAQLGPSTTTPTAGGSNTDSTSLQPAGTTPLQSTTGDSLGLTAPGSNVLQAPATGSDTLRVLASEADGAPVNPDEGGPNYWGWLGFTVAFAVLVTAARIALRRHPAVARRLTSPFRRRPR
jgi:hypothetical protein